jgi:hypothetical protein
MNVDADSVESGSEAQLAWRLNTFFSSVAFGLSVRTRTTHDTQDTEK